MPKTNKIKLWLRKNGEADKWGGKSSFFVEHAYGSLYVFLFLEMSYVFVFFIAKIKARETAFKAAYEKGSPLPELDTSQPDYLRKTVFFVLSGVLLTGAFLYEIFFYFPPDWSITAFGGRIAIYDFPYHLLKESVIIWISIFFVPFLVGAIYLAIISFKYKR